MESPRDVQEATVIIIGGMFEVDPDDRERFLTSRHDRMRASRAEPGCLEYTLSADPVDPSRVVLFERWASQEALDAHLAAARALPPPAGPPAVPKASSIMVYDVTGERPLRA
jgi:quinol monooxygenase YgiN